MKRRSVFIYFIFYEENVFYEMFFIFFWVIEERNVFRND